MLQSFIPATVFGNIIGSISGILTGAAISNFLSKSGIPKPLAVVAGTLIGGFVHLIADYFATASIAVATGDIVTLAANNVTSPIETALTSPLIFVASALAVGVGE